MTLGSRCGAFCAGIYLDSALAIMLEKSKPFPGKKQLPYPWQSWLLHPVPLPHCPFYVVCFVCVFFFFPFILSFLPPCILSPAEEIAAYADSGGVKRLAVGHRHTITLLGNRLALLSHWEPQKNPPGFLQCKTWSLEAPSNILLGTLPC